MDVETLPGGTRVYTDENHRITTDALLLAAFCEAKPGWSACDLGAGGGVVLLSLMDAGLDGRVVGVEWEPQGCALLARGLADSGHPGALAVQADIRDYKTEGEPFDLVVANPPYFAAGRQAQHPVRAQARHQGECTVEDWCAAAARLLKTRGRFCLCWPPARLAGLITAMVRHGIAPKRLRLVRRSPQDEPWLALVDGRRQGGEGLRVLPDLLLGTGQPVEY